MWVLTVFTCFSKLVHCCSWSVVFCTREPPPSQVAAEREEAAAMKEEAEAAQERLTGVQEELKGQQEQLEAGKADLEAAARQLKAGQVCRSPLHRISVYFSRIATIRR